MRSTIRLIRRFLMLMMCIVPIMLVLNFALLILFTAKGRETGGGWTAARELGEELEWQEGVGEGAKDVSIPRSGYVLSERGEDILARYGAWAILVEDGTGDVIWHSENLPEGIPMHYSAAELSWYTRGYIQDYPTTTGGRGEDLMILGHPKDAYWKAMWNTFNYEFIAGIPRMAVTFVLMNGIMIFLIYMILSSRILNSVKPVIQGMEEVPEKEVYVKERGFLAEVAAAVNRVNEKLRAQERALKRKENARASWIAGVSHDIRTPLSMVMGYAAELEEDGALAREARKKAGVIRLQSQRMKNLIGDLNLASRLEYQMQPFRKEKLNLAGVLRRAAADFMNLDPEGRYPVAFQGPGDEESCRMLGDRELLQRAFSNVLNNSQLHNPEGCHIAVELRREKENLCIVMEDDGKGVTEEQLHELRNKPHYMEAEEKILQKRHGLGLMIVGQIAAAHKGTVQVGHGAAGGFRVEITLPGE